MLPPGRGTPRQVVEKSQRERLFAAIVATVAAKGYEATTVADLVDLSGVSRSAYYRHFKDKEACFLAAIESLVQPALEIGAAELEGADAAAAKQAFERLIGAIVSQPAAAKMCLVEVYAAGPMGIALADRALGELVALAQRLLDSIPGHKGMPTEMVRGLIGAVQTVIRKRIYSGTEEELVVLAPQLWEWIFSYPPPPGPLRTPRKPELRVRTFEKRQATSSPPERVRRALAAVVAEKGYPETSVAQVVSLARTSQRTFYDNFGNRDEALISALDSGASQMLAAALPVYRSASEWQERLRGTVAALFGFAVAEPEYTRLGAMEMYANGKKAQVQREVVGELMEGLLKPGYELAPQTPKVDVEAIGGAVYALLYEQAMRKGPKQDLARMVAVAIYVALAPFVGAAEAYAVANGDGGAVVKRRGVQV